MKTKNVTCFNGKQNVQREAEIHGDVVIFKGRTGYWVARNEVTGKITNNCDKTTAISEVSK